MEFINDKLIEFNNNLRGKKVAIIGLGVSNIPLLEYFSDKEVDLTIFNDKELVNEVNEIIIKYNYKVIVGQDYLTKLNGFDIIFRAPSCMPTKPEIKAEKQRGAIVTTEIEQVIKLAPCKVIGVTGTEGKTTTTSIIDAVLKQAGIKSYLGGNIGKPLFTILNEITPEDVIVLEMSSFQLSEMEISSEISVVTNMFPDHLNVHKDMEEYIEAKKNIFKFQDKNGILILNKDNDITNKFYVEANGKVIYFSSKEKLENGYFYDTEDGYVKYSEDENVTNIIHKNDIKLRGVHNYENICAALAATDTLVNRENQIEAIKSFIGVEHRLEFVRELDGVKYYNDSIGTSPASTIAGLNSFDENIVLLAGGSDKGLDYTEIGEKIAEKVGTLILTGPTAKIIEEATLNGINKLYPNKQIDICHCNNLEEAVKLSKEKAIPGDIVLLSPASASFDSFKNFAERGCKFKKFVNKL